MRTGASEFNSIALNFENVLLSNGNDNVTGSRATTLCSSFDTIDGGTDTVYGASGDNVIHGGIGDDRDKASPDLAACLNGHDG